MYSQDPRYSGLEIAWRVSVDAHVFVTSSSSYFSSLSSRCHIRLQSARFPHLSCFVNLGVFFQTLSRCHIVGLSLSPAS